MSEFVTGKSSWYETSLYRPQSIEQQDYEFDVISYKSRSQTIRGWKGHKTTLAAISPIEYDGIIWCVKVPTGAFVAVRNGKAFVTGNSGFPKSLNISKAIESHIKSGKSDSKHTANGKARDRAGKHWSEFPASSLEPDNFVPTIEEAKKWRGFGTSLKPAHEPIVLARKPLIGTVAANVLQHGVEGLNIDGCRVPVSDTDVRDVGRQITRNVRPEDGWGMNRTVAEGGVSVVKPEGRWPANIIHDGSDEVEDAFAAFGERPSCMSPSNANPEGSILGGRRTQGNLPMDSGTASRFFYSSKASKIDRCGSKHPTVKPINLMRYLCKLITPIGGTVLDPFAGTGTTGQAAAEEGYSAVLIEREAVYCDDIRRRPKLYLNTEDQLISW